MTWVIETCFYCGQQYHPMPIYLLKIPARGKDPVRFVCHEREDPKTGKYVDTDCRQKAEADGYVYSVKQTPRR